MKFRSILDLDIKLNGENPEEIVKNLEALVQHHAMGKGLVTGEGPATITTWKHRVEKKGKTSTISKKAF